MKKSYQNTPSASFPKENPRDYNESRDDITFANDINQPVFSFFKGPISNTKPTREIGLLDIYNLIKGETYKQQTSNLRKTKESQTARKRKSNLDYVTFSGTFTSRSEADLKMHSGLMVLDFDLLENPAKVKSDLLKDPYFETELLFLSPSGNGLKWVITVDLSAVDHPNYYRAVTNYLKYTYGYDVDPSGKDISRACFLAHDPNVYINPKRINHE
ncbi:BT4734/BF3469 family protein [Robertkochia sediminum]|uniref:BT4734/BF3469 family protein n=1 Tax=Robertkochia sediminum TaxID=2785326 RepID=UPI001931EFD6|nr:BT4734/BF3469 family protein [Robertkochia sediminum]MBL7473088.1 virulence protein E [Robertkochia sediminum]